MPADSHTMEVRSGEEVTIRPIKPVGEDVDTDDLAFYSRCDLPRRVPSPIHDP